MTSSTICAIHVNPLGFELQGSDGLLQQDRLMTVFHSPGYSDSDSSSSERPVSVSVCSSH